MAIKKEKYLEELQTYIRACRTQGKSDQDILIELTTHGHEHDTVQHAFETIGTNTEQKTRSEEKTNEDTTGTKTISRKKSLKWLWITICITAMMLITIFFVIGEGGIVGSKVVDCGTAKTTTELGEATYKNNGQTTTAPNYEKDEARKCIGKNIIACKQAKMKIEENSESYLEVQGKKGNNCVISISYGTTTEPHLEPVQNKELSCPIATKTLPAYGCLLDEENCEWNGKPGFVTGGIESTMTLQIIYSTEQRGTPDCQGGEIQVSI